ncbi:hypothetical protein [Capnocytophaga canis]|uniref:hypothetical protein n=2 Tax=Capnocytophaga canis TaxID=1848903 RepID=UPI001562AB0C|nr:hypothetical protein [Capnocytophaga canis]
MAEIKTYGLKSVKHADPKPDGTFPDSGLTELCRTYQNSCEFTEDDPQITEEYCDQADDPVMTFMEKGGKNIKFSAFDYSPETLKALKGGTVLDSKWHEPTATAEIYRAIELTTDTGLKFMFPKCRVFAKFNAKFVKNGMMLLEVTLKPVSPAPNKSAVIIG